MNLARVSSLIARGTALLALGLHAAHAALPTVSTPVREAAPPAAVGGAGLLQAGFGMAAVVGLIFLCAWLARRFGLQRLGGGQVVKVVSTAMVGPRERVVVVEVAGQWLVLGVTGSQVHTLHTLHTLPAQATPSVAMPVPAQTPMGLFAQKLRDAVAGKARTTP